MTWSQSDREQRRLENVYFCQLSSQEDRCADDSFLDLFILFKSIGGTEESAISSAVQQRDITNITTSSCKPK